MSRARATALVLGLAMAVAAALATRAGAHERLESATEYEDVYYLPPATWLPVLSLGYEEALADVLWMRALVYFGDEMLHRGGMVHVFEYTEAMLALDPDFRAPYHWIATAGLYRPVAITPDDVDRTLGIMRRGMARFPDDGELAWTIGATLAFELPPLLEDPAARDQARSEGADYLAMAIRLGAAPEWAVLTSSGLLARVGRAEAAAQHLEEMYASTTDPDIRAEIAAGIAQLRNEAYAQAFVDADDEEERERLRRLPYVHPDLFFLIGSRRADDWREAYENGFARQALDESALAADDVESDADLAAHAP